VYRYHTENISKNFVSLSDTIVIKYYLLLKKISTSETKMIKKSYFFYYKYKSVYSLRRSDKHTQKNDYFNDFFVYSNILYIALNK